MLLGVKSPGAVFLRYASVGLVAALFVYMVWKANATWSPDMRLWKAFGGGAFLLLWFTVFIGPMAQLWRPFSLFLSWRRESGVWFALIGLVHGYLVLDGWVRWGMWELLGYQYIAELDMYLRSEPGFGLANLMGLLALFFALILAATSFDRVVSFLGVSSWKWLHTFAYVIFYLIALHALYFAFIHFSASPERVLRGIPTNYPDNPLRFVYLSAFVSVLFAQLTAFVVSVYRQRQFGK
tara:strand:- start:712 stop:1425 length:714 start_codon:yes stop_codon:yes gene_type:complete